MNIRIEVHFEISWYLNKSRIDINLLETMLSLKYFSSSLFLILHVAKSSSSDNNNLQVTIQIFENLLIGTKIVDLKTKIDLNIDQNKQIRFTINANPYFTIRDNTILYTKGEIDRDSDRNLCTNTDFPTLCQWSGFLMSNIRKDYSLRIIIQDKNDNPPMWNLKYIHLKIPENSNPGSKLDFPLATDLDYGINSIQYYSIDPVSASFFISNAGQTSSTPLLILKKDFKLDRELNPWHNMTLIAYDGGEIKLSGSVPVVIEVLDQNDNSPVFESSQYHINIDEDIVPNTVLPVNIRAFDLDAGAFGNLSYTFAISTLPEVLKTFEINKYTGDIKLIRSLRIATKRKYYDFTVVAKDGGYPPRMGYSSVKVEVTEKNTNAPLIRVTSMPDPSSLVISVTENVDKVGYIVASITVEDKDMGRNSEFNCTLIDKSESFRLNFSKKLGKIKIYSLQTTRIFDREEMNMYSVRVICRDFGSPMLIGSKDIVVEVSDVNDFSPQFSKPEYRIRTTEGNEPDSYIYQLTAIDRDVGDNARLRYKVFCLQNKQTLSIMELCPFQIDNSGRISASSELDREIHPQGFILQIIAFDHGSPPKNGSTRLFLDLEDINDCYPEFSRPKYEMQVAEDYGKLFRRRLVGKVFASDKDLRKNAEVFYRLSRESNVPFEIDSKSGTIFTNRLIDREHSASLIKFNVIAVDNPNNLLFRKTSTAAVVIKVLDVNDHKPQFIYPNKSTTEVRLSYLSKLGTGVVKVIAVDKDIGENGDINYVIMKGNAQGLFQLDFYSGIVSVNKDLTEVNKGHYTLIIRAGDMGRSKMHTTVTQLSIVIDDSTPLYRADEPGLNGIGSGIGGVTRGDSTGTVRNWILTDRKGSREGTDIGSVNNGNSRDLQGGKNKRGKKSGGWWEPNKLIIISILLMTAVVSCVLIGAICIMAKRRNEEMEKSEPNSSRHHGGDNDDPDSVKLDQHIFNSLTSSTNSNANSNVLSGNINSSSNNNKNINNNNNNNNNSITSKVTSSSIVAPISSSVSLCFNNSKLDDLATAIPLLASSPPANAVSFSHRNSVLSDCIRLSGGTVATSNPNNVVTTGAGGLVLLEMSPPHSSVTIPNSINNSYYDSFSHQTNLSTPNYLLT